MLLAPFRLLARLIWLIVHLLHGVVTVIYQRIRYGADWHQHPQHGQVIQQWMQRLCQIAGLHVTIHGYPYSLSSCVMVANHVSWLDIIALMSTTGCRFVSKDSLRFWPIIGFLAQSVGTVFIRRGKRHVLNDIIHVVGRSVEQGKTVCIFPEGTTTSGESVARFHSALLESAISVKRPVQPVTIYYERNGELDQVAPYYGKDNFVIHLLMILAHKRSDINIDFSAPLFTEGLSRQQLASLTHKQIQTSLLMFAGFNHRTGLLEV